ncbi:uncharacterized protein B0H18DRAFT_1114132 [Fomitopsis serialis]|uniref:uncharacterized protein n=1 Tax=Fomitopsis serialis TaxID=139415 RepID=UPI0020073C09|nr:uncharacterized protein B0H18DRAFT_1114132 [Neoantrodia serialis]KAH9935376.1 hypothetical protein B0H18DRAFT_1114132 [Neoantrodia serialis]
MSSAAARKKSVISASTPTIDLPVANNTLLNKAASQSTSLYQQCSALRTRLMHVRDFAEWFSISSPPDSSRRSTDPVTQLWDCFVLGYPLCYLFNLLPDSFKRIDLDVNPSSFDGTEKAKKRAIISFAMRITEIEGCEGFTVSEFLDRNSTDGLVKVVNNVIQLVRQSTDSLTSDGVAPSAETSEGGARFNNIVRELVETERKYVQDLEVMQKYSQAATQMNALDRETIHLLFPGLKDLLNFQRKFLIKLESMAEQSWGDQSWGFPFTENEEALAASYRTYCANYTTASDILLQEMPNLSALDSVLAKSDLPAFLIKPVQRICKYPLLLESLQKAVKGTEYPYHEELAEGVAAAKRVTDRINEAQRQAENEATVEALKLRVDDWKGHELPNFGQLLLDDIFTVTKSAVDREYHVFLFEKIILCCKEYLAAPQNGRKVGKSNSILKKPPISPISPFPGGGSSKKRTTPLLLKGRIFLNNVTKVEPEISAGQYSLAVFWRGDDDLEYFTLRCRNEEQLRMWENQLNRLIQEVASRRASGRSHQRLAHLTQTVPTNGSSQRPSYEQERGYSMFSQSTAYSATSPYSSGPVPPRMGRHPYAAAGEDSAMAAGPANGSYFSGYGGPQGYPPPDGFDLDLDDEFEEYPPTSRPPSGRGTPVGARRPELNGFPSAGSVRSSTHTPVSASAAYNSPYSTGRPSISRNTGSFAQENVPESSLPRASLRNQYSATKLKSAYDKAETRSNPSPRVSGTGPVPMRSRSASQPSAYMPPQNMPPPPLPTSVPWGHRPGQNKRGSGSSQSTGDSSDYSPHSSGSPITPFGSSDSSLTGVSSTRTSHSQHSDQVVTSAASVLSAQVKVKVHFHEDIFVIQVPRSTEFDELVERVGKKIRLCGPRRDDGPLRVKYKDEDGDLVSLGSTEDVQMAFESFKPGNQVTLYVQ